MTDVDATILLPSIYYSLPPFCWQLRTTSTHLCHQRPDLHQQPTNTLTTGIPSHNPKTYTYTNLHYSRGSGAPQRSPLPVRQLIRNKPAAHTLVTHTHRASTELYLWVTQASFLPADAVSGCHCVLTGYLQWGRRLSTAEAVSKCPTLIQGLWKKPTSWVNSMKGHRAERPAWVFYSIIFHDLWVCNLQYSDTGSGCTHHCTFTTYLPYHFPTIL